MAVEVYNHVARTVTKEIVQRRIEALKTGQKMQDLPEELWQESFRFYVKEDKTRRGGPNLRMIRLDPAKPSLTVTGFIFNKFVHPTENRFVTVREAALLQGFPDDMELKGSLTSTQRQVGNAVPVQLAEAVFRAVVSFARRVGYSHKELRALSLFCGAGGLDIGASLPHDGEYHIRTLLAADCWEDACASLRGYRGGETRVVKQDIAAVADPLLFWQNGTGETTAPDLVFGGPPCQAFSQAGKQKALDDERGQLVYDYLRYIERLRPAFFVMENVSNIVSVCGGKLYKDIIRRMEDGGYNVTFGVLNAADYGAPQLRRRAIFIGCRKEMGRVPVPPATHSAADGGSDLFGLAPHVTVGEAFSGLPALE